MKKYIAQEAINEYNEVKTIIEKNKNKTIEELYEICHKKFFGSVFNFDGELFDIELNRIEATVTTRSGSPIILDVFDVNTGENYLEGQWSVSCTIEDLQKIINN